MAFERKMMMKSVRDLWCGVLSAALAVLGAANALAADYSFDPSVNYAKHKADGSLEVCFTCTGNGLDMRNWTVFLWNESDSIGYYPSTHKLTNTGFSLDKCAHYFYSDSATETGDVTITIPADGKCKSCGVALSAVWGDQDWNVLIGPHHIWNGGDAHNMDYWVGKASEMAAPKNVTLDPNDDMRKGTSAAGLPYGGDLSSRDAGQVLTPGFFYNLTSDLTLKGDVTSDNPNGSGLIMPESGRVALNLNGFSLKVEGAKAEGTRGGGAGILMNNGSILYICGNGGTLTAQGGVAAAGVKGTDGGAIWQNGADGKSWDCWSGGGGTGGAGGGGAGAGVGTVGGTGGFGGGGGGGGQNITGSMNNPWADGVMGAPGASGRSALGRNFTLVCVSTLKSKSLSGGAAGAGGEGGASGGDGYSKGAEGRYRHAGAGGGGGGGGGGKAGAGVGTGGGGGGQGGGGGGGATDSNDADSGCFWSWGGGYGGKGGNANGKDGATATQQNIGLHGAPGGSGAAGVAGANGVVAEVGSPADSMFRDLMYDVTLDNQGGEGATSTTCFLGETPGAVAVPVRTGYAFGGYFTELDGKGICWFDAKGQGMRLWNTDVKTLYAKWTICSYTVTFDRRGGTGGSTSATATYGAALPSVTPPTRIGAIFQGYFTEPEGRGAQYYDGNGTGMRAWDIAVATTLYASWEVFHYTVTLDAQGGGGGLADFTVTYGEAYPKVSPLPTKTGHTFIGYYEGTDEEAAAIYNSRGVSTNVYEKLSDSTLWAKWRANTYTLSLDGGSFTGKVSVTYGTCPPSVHVPVREGYVFRGYVNGEGVMVYGADGKSTLASYETAANQDLTALWERLPEELVLKSAKQRWPWNGKYDVIYEVDHLDPEKRYAIAGDFTLDETSGTVFVDIPTKSGEGTVMLDAGEIFPAETLTNKAMLTLRLVIRKGE